MLEGSGNNGAWTFLDAVAVASFFIGLQNLDLNVTQGDMQESDERAAKRADKVLGEIHAHLQEQDAKIDEIWRILKDGDRRYL